MKRRIKFDKTVVQRELKKLRTKDGRLTAERVVEAARDPKSPLHAWFEWNESKAAQKWWLEQARALIVWAEIKVVVEERTYTVPSFVRDPKAKPSEQGYRALEDVQKDPDDA